MRIFVTTSLVLLTLTGTAAAGTITKVGAVNALTDVSQMKSITGAAGFDEGPTSGQVPADTYTALGLTWHQGLLTQILPGATTPGSAFLPEYQAGMSYFPPPIAGGGTAVAQYAFFAGVATFTTKITQVGLTASSNGTQYLTVWDAAGQMLGQVTWTPTNAGAFVGIDSLGVPIAMVAYGNDDLWAGATYDIGGSTIIDDSWVWGPGDCVTNADCNDHDPCTDDACNAPDCVFTANTAACDDGSACTTMDVCSGGTCSGVLTDCDDGNDCTIDQCDAVMGCVHHNACDDGNVCTDDQCDVVSGCTYTFNTSSCDDLDACTEGDVCGAGACAGTAKSCDDGDSCTDDSCDPATGCQHVGKTGACDDNNACTTGETCAGGFCSGGTPIKCDDGNECSTDTCDPASGCVHENREGTCGVVAGCMKSSCESGACAAPAPVDCDDQDPCTQDTCAEPDGCAHAAIEGCCHTDADCDDGGACDENHHCAAAPADEEPESATDSGCSCGTPGVADDRAGWIALAAFGLAALRRERHPRAGRRLRPSRGDRRS